MNKSKIAMFWLRLGWPLLLLGTWLGARAAEEVLPKGVAVSSYLAWEGAIVMESDDAEAKLVVVPGIGGRIMRYEVIGENVLWDNPVIYTRAPVEDRRNLLPGGHQMVLYSEPNGAMSLEQLEYGPYAVKPVGDYAVVFGSQPDAATGLRLEKEIVLEPKTGEVGMIQRIKNTSGREVSFGIRCRSLCKSGGFILLPLNKKSRFRRGWSLSHEISGRHVFDNLNPTSPHIKTYGDLLVASTAGEATRFGANTDAEWVAYVLGPAVFIQYFPFDSDGQYPNGGNTIEAGWTAEKLEVDLIGPERTLSPGAERTMPMKWMMLILKEPVTNERKARSLVSKIPPSPFQRAGK